MFGGGQNGGAAQQQSYMNHMRRPVPSAAAPPSLLHAASSSSSTSSSSTAAALGRRGESAGLTPRARSGKKDFKTRLDLACERHGTTTESAKMPVKGCRKVTYVLNWGRISSPGCLQNEKGDVKVIPSGFRVVFEASNYVWQAEIGFSASSAAASGSAMSGAVAASSTVPLYQVHPVGPDGDVEQPGSGWLDNISAAFRRALMSQTADGDAKDNHRPNGRLYLGIFYPAVQDALKDVLRREPARVDPPLRPLVADWLSGKPAAAVVAAAAAVAAGGGSSSGSGGAAAMGAALGACAAAGAAPAEAAEAARVKQEAAQHPTHAQQRPATPMQEMDFTSALAGTAWDDSIVSALSSPAPALNGDAADGYYGLSRARATPSPLSRKPSAASTGSAGNHSLATNGRASQLSSGDAFFSGSNMFAGMDAWTQPPAGTAGGAAAGPGPAVAAAAAAGARAQPDSRKRALADGGQMLLQFATSGRLGRSGAAAAHGIEARLAGILDQIRAPRRGDGRAGEGRASASASAHGDDAEDEDEVSDAERTRRMLSVLHEIKRELMNRTEQKRRRTAAPPRDGASDAGSNASGGARRAGGHPSHFAHPSSSYASFSAPQNHQRQQSQQQQQQYPQHMHNNTQQQQHHHHHQTQHQTHHQHQHQHQHTNHHHNLHHDTHAFPHFASPGPASAPASPHDGNLFGDLGELETVGRTEHDFLDRLSEEGRSIAGRSVADLFDNHVMEDYEYINHMGGGGGGAHSHSTGGNPAADGALSGGSGGSTNPAVAGSSGEAAAARLPIIVGCHMSHKGLFLKLAPPNTAGFSEEELSHAITSLRIPAASSIVRETIKHVAVDENGRVSMDVFLRFLREREDELRIMFNSVDTDGDGYISLRDLKFARDKGDLCQTASDAELQALLEWMDTLENAFEDGKIHFEEFRTGMILLPPATTLTDVIKHFREQGTPEARYKRAPNFDA